MKLLKAKKRPYLKVSYGKASVLARPSVDDELDDQTIRMDQTLRTAICLEKIMQGTGAKRELLYTEDGSGSLNLPVTVQRSNFGGPSVFARLLKQQYLVCLVHHAKPRDMETPIARLSKQSMGVIGIQPGDKVKLISETCQKSLRCLPLDPNVKLPLRSMRRLYPPPCPSKAYRGLLLPWITMDLQTRLDLKVKPWQPIILGRDPYQALATEFNHVALGLALSALGGAIAVPKEISAEHPWLPLSIVMVGLAGVLMLIWVKIRSRI